MVQDVVELIKDYQQDIGSNDVPCGIIYCWKRVTVNAIALGMALASMLPHFATR